MLACFGGWSLDAFDVQMYSFVIPTVIALWGLSNGEAGLIGTVTLLISSLGGWFSGALADRFGRVRMLQITILWYSFFTFLCAFAQNFEQLFILRALHGLGFGGEWAAGAVLMGEVIRDKYRGRGVGLVQTGWAVGWGAAALVYTALYRRSARGDRLARAVRGRPVAGGVRVLDPPPYRRARGLSRRSGETRPAVGLSHLFSAFRGPHLWTTIKVSLMVAGAQGGGYALGIWMPTYLRTVRGICRRPSTGGFLLVQILGALFGFLLGAYLGDAIGRKWTFMLSAIGSLVDGAGLHVRADRATTALLLARRPAQHRAADEIPADGPVHDRAVTRPRCAAPARGSATMPAGRSARCSRDRRVCRRERRSASRSRCSAPSPPAS